MTSWHSGKMGVGVTESIRVKDLGGGKENP